MAPPRMKRDPSHIVSQHQKSRARDLFSFLFPNALSLAQCPRTLLYKCTLVHTYRGYEVQCENVQKALSMVYAVGRYVLFPLNRRYGARNTDPLVRCSLSISFRSPRVTIRFTMLPSSPFALSFHSCCCCCSSVFFAFAA